MSGAKPMALPEELPGEDRKFGGGLTVDLIPVSAWGQSVRSILSKYHWQRLSRGVRKRADRRCEACGVPSQDEKFADLSCHECWEWIESSGLQRLAWLMSLCRDCDAMTHIGYYRTHHGGEDSVPIAHLASIRGWSIPMARAHVVEAENLWTNRSERDWSMNLVILHLTGLLKSAMEARWVPMTE